MAIVGLSILIVSITFFCYRGQAFYRPWWGWLRRRPSTIEETKSPAPPIITSNDGTNELEDEKTQITKEERDRKAMPPPPPSFKRPNPSSTSSSPPTTPRASTTTTPTPIPSFTLLDDDSPPKAPSFPAANSAQRASGGRTGPPRLPRPAPSPSLLPPPRGPLPNRLPPPLSSSSSLAPPPSPSTIPPRPRRKVLLTPGHSPLDWARVSSSGDLRNLPPGTPYLKVPPSLLRKYTGRKGKDAWTVLGGKVYNISPYLPYHPGGEPELLKAAGRDGTKLFGEVHPWVNWEGMLEGCLVGIAVEEGDVKAVGSSTLEDMD